MEGVRTKGTVLKALQENSRVNAQISALEAELAQANQKAQNMQSASRGMQKALMSMGTTEQEGANSV